MAAVLRLNASGHVIFVVVVASSSRNYLVIRSSFSYPLFHNLSLSLCWCKHSVLRWQKFKIVHNQENLNEEQPLCLHPLNFLSAISLFPSFAAAGLSPLTLAFSLTLSKASPRLHATLEFLNATGIQPRHPQSFVPPPSSRLTTTPTLFLAPFWSYVYHHNTHRASFRSSPHNSRHRATLVFPSRFFPISFFLHIFGVRQPFSNLPRASSLFHLVPSLFPPDLFSTSGFRTNTLCTL